MSVEEFTKYLQSSISISKPRIMTYAFWNRTPTEREGVSISIKVENTAPDTYLSGNVVFMGVNLVVTNKKEVIGSSSERWILGVKKSKIIENPAARIKYGQGQSSLNERFPLYTSDEKGHGEMLFPGESIE